MLALLAYFPDWLETHKYASGIMGMLTGVYFVHRVYKIVCVCVES